MPEYLHATPQGSLNLLSRSINGPVVMLNLLNFREAADYTGYPDLDPGHPLTGRQAYGLYMQAVRPLIVGAGGELVFMGRGGKFVVGPEAEGWDMVLVVRYPSVGAFVEFAQSEGYAAIAGHRTAALADSRLLPLEEGWD